MSSELVGATLRSILNQTDARFSVLVACHDRPDIVEMSDKRVQAIEMTTPAPKTLSEQMRDKHEKRRAMAAVLRSEGGGYLMAVDADDLVSCRIVKFVQGDKAPWGYLINDGYEYDYVARRSRRAPHFNRLCGTSGIFRFAALDLPRAFDDAEKALSDNFENHTRWKQVSKVLGRPLRNFPFPAAMYVRNNGENHSTESGNVGRLRSAVRALTPARPLSVSLQREFNFFEGAPV